MASSQQSYNSRIGRFIAGNVLLNSWADYLPVNNHIKKLSMSTLATDIELANTLDVTTKTTLDNARRARALLVFIKKETNPACLERRIQTIVNYLQGELGKSHQATKFIKSIRQKMRPKYSKKPPGTPRGAGNSPMERSFAAAVGQAQQVISRITALGVAYAPADPNLLPAAMTTLVNAIIAANDAVSAAMDAYGNANRARKALYDGDNGMKERISSAKGYLSSFQGGKKSDRYIEYAQAIKGV